MSNIQTYIYFISTAISCLFLCCYYIPGKKKGPSTGLPYCPQPTPEWQKSVKSFFTFTSKKDVSTDDKEVDDDKENEQVVTNDEEEESPTRTKRSKGKQPQKGKTTKKDSKMYVRLNVIEEGVKKSCFAYALFCKLKMER